MLGASFISEFFTPKEVWAILMVIIPYLNPVPVTERLCYVQWQNKDSQKIAF